MNSLLKSILFSWPILLVFPGWGIAETESKVSLQPRTLASDVDPLSIGQRVYSVFEHDPVKALKLVTQMELYARYDMSRIKDTSAHEALYAMRDKLGLQRVSRWGARHPGEYRRAVLWVIEWAKKSKPPSYQPLWMMKHGLDYKSNSDAPDKLLVANHSPTEAWQKEIAELEKFHQSPHWRKLEEELKDENIKKTLVGIFDRSIQPYIRTRSGEDLAAIERNLREIVTRYDALEGEPGDKVYQIEYMIEQYLFTQVGR